jgi:beta-glucosidase
MPDDRPLSNAPNTAMKKLILSLVVAGSLASFVAAEETGLESPVVAGGGTFRLERPEIYRRGWVDLNKNGVKDIYEDPAQPVDARVEDLLGRMTREERLGQLWQRKMAKDSDAQDARLLTAGGLGSYIGAAPDAGPRNRLQRLAVEDSRLGIPLIFGFDTIHGFRTIFPIPLGLSCAWDPALVEQIDTVAAAESAAAGVDWVFAPMVDIARDPRWGRIAEGAGEDPWLGGRIAAAAVRGFQGNRIGQAGRVAACLKHFVGYGAAEGGRDYNTTEIGLPTLRNVYLPPFKAGVDAGAATLMSAFNCLDGVPASGNRFTLTEVLRDQWGFHGFVVSDWAAVEELIHHGYAADKAQAASLALHAGVDMEMVSDCYHTSLRDLLDAGTVTPAVFNQAERRILHLKIEKGLLDRPYTAPVELDKGAAVALAREAAARCCVLLKNDHDTLPLHAGGTVALIGPLADDQHDLLGCWAGLGRDEDVVTLKDGLAAALAGTKLLTANGCDLTSNDTTGLAGAVAAARQADVVILAVGEPAAFSGENKSRSELGLPGVQQQLFDEIVATGKPVVTVLFAGRPLAVPAVLEKSAAVLMAWHPGVQGGPGIAAVLTGAVDPSGRLTTTFPRSAGQLPVYYNHLRTGRPLADYKDGPREPLLPFGYGLTYTRFEYGPTCLSADHLRDGSITATATVTNVGARAGTEVVQLYLHDVACSFGARPMRELKGFERVTLKPGESREVSFAFTPSELGCWSSDGKWVVEPGRFEVVIAPNAAGGQMTGFTLEP